MIHCDASVFPTFNFEILDILYSKLFSNAVIL